MPKSLVKEEVTVLFYMKLPDFRDSVAFSEGSQTSPFVVLIRATRK